MQAKVNLVTMVKKQHLMEKIYGVTAMILLEMFSGVLMISLGTTEKKISFNFSKANTDFV